MAAGIDYASGKYIALLDGDLQNDPTDIPFMLEKLMKEDWDVVAGNRANRKDGAFLRKIPSNIANAIIRSMTKVYFKDYGCTLKIFRHEIAEDLGLYGELHRFIPVLAAMQGARITQVDVKHHARQFGQVEIWAWQNLSCDERPRNHGVFPKIQPETDALVRRHLALCQFVHWHPHQSVPAYVETDG